MYGEPETAFSLFKTKYGKSYGDAESESAAFAVFSANYDVAAQLTSANAAAGGTAVFGMSPFMDVPADEFAASHLMPKGVLEATLTSNAFLARGGEAAIPTQSPPLGTTLPKSFDWRNSNTPVITPVKNQGQCGSCWGTFLSLPP